MGFPNGISGSELAERAALQAEKFGARLLVPCEACRLERRSDHFEVPLSGGGSTVAKAVIVATGARYRRLGVPDLDRFEGLGVFYAATESEALRCIDQPVLIVGGGNSAGQAAIFLSRRGVFAVGDVRSGSVKRVASAAGEGAMAVRMVHERLARNLAREKLQVAPGL